MNIIAKNQTGVLINIQINGSKKIQVPANGQIDMLTQATRDEIAYSSDLVYNIINNNISINDGLVDLNQVNAIDFVRNYVQTILIDPETGFQKTQSSPKPDGYTTVYQGNCDDEAIADGIKCIFKMEATGDSTKSKEFEFCSDIYMKDGIITCENAPLGATVDVELLHPEYGIVGWFCRGLNILGTTRYDLNSDDRGKVPAGLKIKISVHNADGTGEEDAKVDFKVSGNFEIYRLITDV